MNRRILFWILTIFGGFLLQIFLADFLSIDGAYPNLLLLATIYFAVEDGSLVGEWTGFLWGLLADVATISMFGLQSFMFTLIGYISGKLQGQIDEEKPVAQMTLVFFMSLFHLLGMIAFDALFGLSLDRYKTTISFLAPVYSTLASPLVFWVLTKWRARFFRVYA